MTPPPTTLTPPAGLPTPTDWWVDPDVWQIIGGIVAVITLAGAVTLWVIRAVRQRRARSVGPRRRLLRRDGPVVRNDWPPLSARFTGRTNLLSQLRRRLGTRRPVVLHGLGGVGKTQTVLAYLERHQRAYQVIWWVRAEQTATLTQDLARLAGPLGLPERADPDQTVVVGAVRRWLAGNGRWLLVLDNATTEHELVGLLPAQPLRGHMLVTSRNQLWPDAAQVHVHPWTPEESLAFLGASLPPLSVGTRRR